MIRHQLRREGRARCVQAANVHPGTDNTQGDQMRVLLVEDDAFVRAIVSENLRDEGHTVTEAPTGSAGLAMIEAEARGYDALVTDIRLTGDPNGIELARTMRRLHPSAPIVVASGCVDVFPMEGTPRVSVLAKPYRMADLLPLLRSPATLAPGGSR